MVPTMCSTWDMLKTNRVGSLPVLLTAVCVRVCRGNLEDRVVGWDHLQSLHVPIFTMS